MTIHHSFNLCSTATCSSHYTQPSSGSLYKIMNRIHKCTIPHIPFSCDYQVKIEKRGNDTLRSANKNRKALLIVRSWKIMQLLKFFCSRILVMIKFLQTVVPVKVKPGVLLKMQHSTLSWDVWHEVSHPKTILDLSIYALWNFHSSIENNTGENTLKHYAAKHVHSIRNGWVVCLAASGTAGSKRVKKRKKNMFLCSKKWPIISLVSKKHFMTILTLRSKAWPWSILHIWSTFLSSCWNLSIATWQLGEFVLELWRLVCKKTWGVRATLSWTCHYTAPRLAVAVCLLSCHK